MRGCRAVGRVLAVVLKRILNIIFQNLRSSVPVSPVRSSRDSGSLAFGPVPIQLYPSFYESGASESSSCSSSSDLGSDNGGCSGGGGE